MKPTLCILLLSAATALGEVPRDVPHDATAPPLTMPLSTPGGATERACYLGVATSTATPALREQFGLPHGVGVVVEMVDANSPAEQAGLEPRDVIEQLNDQLVINVQQLSVLVRLQKPGNTVKLHLLRHGQAMEIKAQLAERELPVLEEARPVVPTAILPRVGVGRSCSVVTHTDGDDVITLTTRDDDRRLTVKDVQGTTLFDGPLNTAEDESKVPQALREKLQRILASTDRFKEIMPHGGN